jgi:thymidylate synthase (FAD)
MRVTLLDHTANPEITIGRMAGICYDSKTDDVSCVKRTAHCRDSGHLATLRFAYATFHIEGIRRVCSHQLVRVAHAGILQRSQRYVKETSVEFVVPDSVRNLPPELYDKWAGILARSQQLYLDAIEAGMKKEDARYILPQSCTTALNVTGNFQMWKDIIANRTTKHAQWEIREVFTEVDRQLGRLSPNLFGVEK